MATNDKKPDNPHIGIDYGRLGATNRNVESGIRYGVISGRLLTDWVAYESGETIYPESEDDESEDDEPYFDDCLEPIAYLIDETEDESGLYMHCELGSYATDDSFFVESSNYYCYAPNCSPCAPGALYIADAYDPRDYRNPNLDSLPVCYCPPPDYFAEPPSFPIYRVSDDSIAYDPKNNQ